MLTLVTCLLAAAPLSVRVLEKTHPTRATLESTKLSCDGAPVTSPAAVSIREAKLLVNDVSCAELLAAGPVTLRVGDESRRLPGQLRVTADGVVLRLINSVDVEEYLPSVVAAELSGAPVAATEAQAVVSRTFALASRKRHGKAGYDICDLTHCQLYRGLGAETKESTAAVRATKNQVLLIGGMVLKPTFFHAACGGHTSRAADVFGEDASNAAVSDLDGASPACRDTTDFKWEWQVERTQLAAAVAGNADGNAFEPLRRDTAGRVIEVRSFGRRFSGAAFQSLVGQHFGWQSLRSMRVSMTESEGVLQFTGTGIGHGVGLCQQGARALAEKGLSREALLKRYFPDSVVRTPEELGALPFRTRE